MGGKGEKEEVREGYMEGEREGKNWVLSANNTSLCLYIKQN